MRRIPPFTCHLKPHRSEPMVTVRIRLSSGVAGPDAAAPGRLDRAHIAGPQESAWTTERWGGGTRSAVIRTAGREVVDWEAWSDIQRTGWPAERRPVRRLERPLPIRARGLCGNTRESARPRPHHTALGPRRRAGPPRDAGPPRHPLGRQDSRSQASHTRGRTEETDTEQARSRGGPAIFATTQPWVVSLSFGSPVVKNSHHAIYNVTERGSSRRYRVPLGSPSTLHVAILRFSQGETSRSS